MHVHILFASCILRGWSQHDLKFDEPCKGRQPLFGLFGEKNCSRPKSTTVRLSCLRQKSAKQRGLDSTERGPTSTTVHRVTDESQLLFPHRSKWRRHPRLTLRRTRDAHDGSKRTGSALTSNGLAVHRASGTLAIAPRTRPLIDSS